MDVLTPGPGAEPPLDAPQAHRPRWVWWALAGIAGIGLVAAVVIGALRGPVVLDAASPEGVVQAYMQSVLDGDVAAARGLLARDVADACSSAVFHTAWVPDGLSATLVDVDVQDDRATVEVRLRTPAGPGPLGGDGTTQIEVFELAREGGAWLIGADPWPVYDCGRK